MKSTKMRMKKRAIIMTTIITVIVLVVTLSALVYLATNQLNLKDNIDTQACLASVNARSTFNFGNLIEPGRDFIPLNCKTEKICISSSGSECEEAVGFKPSEENEIKTEKIKDPKKTRAEVLDIISQNLYDCHLQLGQGKLNFMPSKFYSKNYCLICDRIVLDEETKKNLGEKVTYLELYSHMKTKTDKDGTSYLKYVYKVDDVTELLPILRDVTNKVEEEARKKNPNAEIEISDLTLDLNNPNGNAIIAQLSVSGNWDTILLQGLGIGLVDGGLISMAIAIPTGGGSLFVYGAVLTVVGGLSIAAGALIDDGNLIGEEDIALASGPIFVSRTIDGTSYGHPTLFSYNAETLSGLGCTSFELAPRVG